MVVNPNRTSASSFVMTDSIASLSWVHDVSALLAQTLPWVELRQWNMLPDRSTTR